MKNILNNVKACPNVSSAEKEPSSIIRKWSVKKLRRRVLKNPKKIEANTSKNEVDLDSSLLLFGNEFFKEPVEHFIDFSDQDSLQESDEQYGKFEILNIIINNGQVEFEGHSNNIFGQMKKIYQN